MEQAHTAGIHTALNGQLDHIKAAGEQFHDIRQAIDTLPGESLLDAIQRILIAGVEAGTAVSFAQLDGLSMAVNWGLANHAAKEWARNYTFSLVHDINITTKRVASEFLSEWVQSGNPYQSLVDDLTHLFGEDRATLIASTEATRAYGEGSFTTYEQAGFEKRPSEDKRPPGHPRCRCWVGVEERNGAWYYVWYTSNDEIVRQCDICWPLNNQIIGFAGKM